MIIGIDFDNTIVCYDGLFYEAAVARQLVPAETPRAKEAVRDFLRAANQEAAWTELQGLIYGHEISRAKPFAGVAQFLQRCRVEGATALVISHRTRQPFAGAPIDLQQAARGWLTNQRLFADVPDEIMAQRFFFEETKAAKLARITSSKCDVFIDDLPELLAASEFPAGVRRILFDPHARWLHESRFERSGSWRELSELLFPAETP